MRTVLDVGDEVDKAWCKACGVEITVPKSLVDGIKSWNRAEHRDAEKEQRKPEFIGLRTVFCCDACTPAERARRSQQAIDEATKTQVFLRELHRGNHNAEIRDWLRRHGYGSSVDRQLQQEGNPNG